MTSMKKIQQTLGERVCRRCINEHYQADLQPGDCVYYSYPATCAVCGQERHIVVELKLSGKMKMMLK